MDTEMSIIVPTRNEAECIEKTLGKICEALEKGGIGYEILVMDDNSRDGTKEKVAELAKRNPRIRLVNRGEPYGFGYSIKDGLRMAKGKYSVVMMADLSDDPELLPKIKEKMDLGCDAVVCSRFMKGSEVRRYPFLKMVSNRLFNWTVGIAFNLEPAMHPMRISASGREWRGSCMWSQGVSK